MAEVVQMDAFAESRRYVVGLLRDMLARAEAGELRSVHLCAFLVDGGSMERHAAGAYNVHECVAALEYAKHGLIASNSGPA